VNIQLGTNYRDSVTGFRGTCTAIVTRLGDSARACLERLAPDGSVKEEWFDTARLETDIG